MTDCRRDIAKIDGHDRGRVGPWPARQEQVILVDGSGNEIGSAEKQYAHQLGLRHRAFSVFLVDDAGRVLLQQRHPSKYHSGGLWANSCCGHPRPGETIGSAAERRLTEELGLRVRLHFGFRTAYAAAVGNGLTENEIVSIFFGRLALPLRHDPAEVSQTRIVPYQQLSADIGKRPQIYAAWLRHYVDYHDLQIAAFCRRLADFGDVRWRPARSRRVSEYDHAAKILS